MSHVSIDWLLENKIIQVITEGDLALDDVRTVSNAVIDHINQSPAPLVHVVLSEEKMDSLPKSLKAFSEVVEFLRHDRIGWFLIYGNTSHAPIAKFLGTMVIEMAKVRHRRFETLQESLDFLVSMDTTLPTVDEMLNQ